MAALLTKPRFGQLKNPPAKKAKIATRWVLVNLRQTACIERFRFGSE
jgi:hypothetical protein